MLIFFFSSLFDYHDSKFRAVGFLLLHFAPASHYFQIGREKWFSGKIRYFADDSDATSSCEKSYQNMLWSCVEVAARLISEFLVSLSIAIWLFRVGKNRKLHSAEWDDCRVRECTKHRKNHFNVNSLSLVVRGLSCFFFVVSCVIREFKISSTKNTILVSLGRLPCLVQQHDWSHLLLLFNSLNHKAEQSSSIAESESKPRQMPSTFVFLSLSFTM